MCCRGRAARQWIVAAKLHHPNIIQLHDVQVSASHVFLIMELASGCELFDRVNQSGGMPEEQALVTFTQILSGEGTLHFISRVCQPERARMHG